jgi:hypothetical protein
VVGHSLREVVLEEEMVTAVLRELPAVEAECRELLESVV